jgi:hypothetical protein
VLVLASASDDVFHSFLIRVDADPSLSIILVRMGDCAHHHLERTAALLLPDNMLLNIGLDVARTDLVCVLPSELTKTWRLISSSEESEGLEEEQSVTRRLREMLIEADTALQRGNEWASLYPPVAALVVPAFFSPADSSSQSVPSPFRHVCGRDQPDSLMPRYEEFSEQTVEGAAVAFNAQVSILSCP